MTHGPVTLRVQSGSRLAATTVLAKQTMTVAPVPWALPSASLNFRVCLSFLVSAPGARVSAGTGFPLLPAACDTRSPPARKHYSQPDPLLTDHCAYGLVSDVKQPGPADAAPTGRLRDKAS